MIQNRIRTVQSVKIIGITGATGAGKSALCAELKKRGAEIIDADKIAKENSLRGGAAFNEIIAAFGREILDESGEINRKGLAEIVFADRERLELLNKITHKYVYAEIERRLAECKAETAVLDVPLLFEKGSPLKCDLTVAVTAKPEIRERRIMERDKICREAARARMKNQMSDQEYSEKADVMVDNSGSAEKMADFAEEILEKIKL